ncbi:MAG: glycosyltransferase involved in cell wall biosynthesis [Litorivivens sp.]
MSRICHITTIHPTFDTRIFKKECKSLLAAGHQVTLLAGNADSQVVDGVNVIGLKYNPGRINRFLLGPKVFYNWCLDNNFDVYHFHDPEFLPFAKKLAIQGKKIIYDAHEDVPRQILAKYYIPKFIRPIVSRRFERMENSCIPHFSGVSSATEHIAQRFSSMNSNSIAVHNYPSLKELGDFVLPSMKPKNTLCYIGSITNIRGAWNMVDLMGRLSANLNLGGSFSPPSLQSQLVRKPGWKQVNSLGFLSREEVVSTLDHSQLGLVLLHATVNYKDALPVKMFEYMAKGLPVVITDVPLWKSIVDECTCGLAVDLAQPEDIAKAVQVLLADENKMDNMAKRGRAAVEEKYNWEQEERKLFELYEKVI